ncbi:hypothetical protein FH972_027185 [Carpinus fangiana]|uniref:Late embryogenesis abundant protein LEA-2 subgroup domain-containing protein n=1 Tax=Carpinus fangiana TaxID=176857 RepID=A0A5N6L6I5_9ROSI|nr:hypothetical protein FH972_027185 [Carpinus fangiana]
MHNPGGAAGRPGHSKLLRCIAVVLLTLIVLVGLAVLIIWLAVRPRQLVYTVEDGSIRSFNLANNRLNASFDFVIRSYNPNSKVSVYYDSIEASTSYQDQIVAYSVVDPFFQPHRNVTRLELKLAAQSVALVGSTARDLRSDKSAGEIELTVLLKAKIRFKLGTWKSKHRTLRPSLSSPWNSNRASERARDHSLCRRDHHVLIFDPALRSISNKSISKLFFDSGVPIYNRVIIFLNLALMASLRRGRACIRNASVLENQATAQNLAVLNVAIELGCDFLGCWWRGV